MSEGLIPLLKQLLQTVAPEEKQSFLSSIYSEESMVVIVFQQLGELEKSFVFRLLLVDRPIKEQLFAFWTAVPMEGLSAKNYYEPALKSLLALGVLNEAAESSFELDTNFRRVLINVIYNKSVSKNAFQSSVWTISDAALVSSADVRSPSSSVGETKWHALLERSISPAPQVVSESDLDRVILRLGFGTYPTPPVAYRFILSDVSTQLWTFISEFVLLVERQRDAGGLAAVAEVLKVISAIMLVSNETTLFLNSSNNTVKRTVQVLHDLDCIRSLAEGNPFQKPQMALGPTALALRHRSQQTQQDLLIGAKLIVDSNMHVTAYTRSNLQVKLISLFCEVHRVMGKVLAGILTRSSVQKAIDGGGVSSESIIKFLSSNLHPKCGDKLPTNVSLQIRLWETDCPRNRLKMEPCVLLSWRGDRTEQTNRAITQVKQLAESNKGLLFTKQDPDGRMYLGIKSSVAKIIFPQF